MVNFVASKYFDKKFTFVKDKRAKKLSFADDQNVLQLLDNLSVLKDKLNVVKSKTGDYDLAAWSAHTKTRDVSQGIFRYFRNKYQPELLTQAWLKFYEILSNFNLVHSFYRNDSTGTLEIGSVHLCEAPGAFITAFNHFLANHVENYQFSYLGMTLNPYHSGNNLKEMIAQDRFILNKFENWYFGPDETGDIKQYHNYHGLISYIKDKFGTELVDFVTADGSVNCMDDPGNQENIVWHLLFCETISALTILRKDGHFVLKIFTIFEKNTIALLILLNECFKRVTIFKPCTSKAGNSELYVVCEKYMNPNYFHELLPQFIELYRMGNSDTFHQVINACSIDLGQIFQCARLFTNYQMETISDNLSTFDVTTVNCDELNKLRSNIVRYYTKICKPQKLQPISALMDTYEEKLYLNRLYLKNTSDFTFKSFPFGDFYTLNNTKNNFASIELKIVVGKSFKTVFSTKFCDHDISSIQIPNLFNNRIDLPSELRVINCEKFYRENHDSCDKLVLENVLEILKTLSEHDNLILINVLPLTLFSVNVLYILKDFFTTVHCNSERRQLLFENFNKSDCALHILQTVFDEQQNLIKNVDNHFDKTIIRFLNPKLIFLDIFYEFIKFYNNAIFNKNN